MGVNVVTHPLEEPVSLAEAKEHLKVDGSDEDAYISALIVAAREFCEERQRRVYVTQTLEYTLARFPSDRHIDLPRPKLQSIQGVTYTDADGVTHTFDSSNYVADTKSVVGSLHLRPGASWPSFTPYPVNAVAITYVAGYGGAANVPKRIKQAILLLVGHWYANREAVIVGSTTRAIEFAVDALLASDRVYWGW